MAAPIIEHQARAHDQVLDRARHEDFTSTSKGGDPGPDMDGEPGDVIGQDLDLAGMSPVEGPDRPDLGRRDLKQRRVTSETCVWAGVSSAAHRCCRRRPGG
jgi:hypothetical protein